VSEARRFGHDAVRPAGHHGATVLEREPLRRGEQVLDTLEQQVGRVSKLQRQRRVEHVGRREPEMDPPSGFADGLGDILDERGDVVPGDAFELLDAREVERSALAHLTRVAVGHDAEPRPRLDDEDLDLQPVAQASGVGPHRRHLGKGVPRDHISRRVVTDATPPPGRP
jgi:hypothetical protein